jgi:hypothetical protein
VLDRNGRVHPFPTPISVRMPVTFKQEALALEKIGGRVAERPMKIGLILGTRYQEGSRSRFREASHGQGALDLVANAVAARWAPSRVLRTTRRGCTSAIVLRGPRGEARETVERLFAIADWPDVHKNLQEGVRNVITGESVAAEG